MIERIEYFDQQIKDKLKQIPRAIDGNAPKEVIEKILEEIYLLKKCIKLFSLQVVGKRSELLMRDELLKSREETAKVRERTAIEQTLQIYCDLEELPTVDEVLERIGRKH